MLDLHLAQRQLNNLGYAEPNHTLERIERARHLFQRRYLKGKLEAFKAKITGRPTQMLSLAEVTATGKVSTRHAGRLQVVPIGQIQGSEGRTRDFDRQFNPRQTHTQERWMNLAIAMMVEVPLPPVQLIQVGEHYYVRDGHHRISVARALGYSHIDAEVLVWELEPKTGPEVRPVPEKHEPAYPERNHPLPLGSCLQPVPCLSVPARCACHS